MGKSTKFLEHTLAEIFNTIKKYNISDSAKVLSTNRNTLKKYIAKIEYVDPITEQPKKLIYEDLLEMTEDQKALLFKDKLNLKLKDILDAQPQQHSGPTLSQIHELLLKVNSLNAVSLRTDVALGTLQSFINKFTFLKDGKWEILNEDKLKKMTAEEALSHWGSNYTKTLEKVRFEPRNLPIFHILYNIRQSATDVGAARKLLINLPVLENFINNLLFVDVNGLQYGLNFDLIRESKLEDLRVLFGDAFKTSVSDYFKDDTKQIFAVPHDLRKSAFILHIEISNDNNNANNNVKNHYSPSFFANLQTYAIFLIQEISSKDLQFFYSGDPKHAIQVVWQGDTSKYVPNILEHLDLQMRSNYLTHYLTVFSSNKKQLGSDGTFFMAFTKKAEQGLRSEFPLNRIFTALLEGIDLHDLNDLILQQILLENTKSFDHEPLPKRRK